MGINTLVLALGAPPVLGPRHAHDCEFCRYIGRVDIGGEPERDVYVCLEEGRDTLVVRRSDDEPDYTSFSVDHARKAAPTSLPWKGAVTLYEGWEEAGRPA